MNYTYSRTSFSIRRSNSRPGLWWLNLLITGLVWACNLRQPTDLEQTQATNIRLTKTFHTHLNHLNHHNWSALEKFCAETVRYGGSGGEVRVNNNADADKIDYFQQ